MKTPLNARTLKNHFRYSWWLYAVVLLAGTFLVSLVYDMTAPRTPPEKKLAFYIYGVANADAVNTYMEELRQSDFPDLEEMDCTVLSMDDTYGSIQLTTYIAAREGDIYILPREQFLSLSAGGAFLPLEEDEELIRLFTEAGLDLRRGWRTDSDSGERHLVGIPTDLLPGMMRMILADNCFLSVPAYGGNIENAEKFLRIFCRDMLQPLPEEEPAPEDESGAGSVAEEANP